MQTPAELGVAAVLARATRVVAHVQLVAALGHGRDTQVKLSRGKHGHHDASTV